MEVDKGYDPHDGGGGYYPVLPAPKKDDESGAYWRCPFCLAILNAKNPECGCGHYWPNAGGGE